MNGVGFYSLLLMQDSAGAVIGALIGSWLPLYDFHFSLLGWRWRIRSCGYF